MNNPIDTKVCKGCGLEKPITDYHRDKSRKDGLQVRCKPCNISNTIKYQKKDGNKRVYQHHKRYKTTLVKTLNNIKASYGCHNCDEKEGFCLDFHHLNDDKVESVSRLLSSKKYRDMILEVNKCIVLCSNCHRKLHNKVITLDEPRLCVLTYEEWTEEIMKVKGVLA